MPGELLLAPQLAILARGMKELEASSRCTVAAVHIAGKYNSVSDSLPRFSGRAQGQDLYLGRGLRSKRRREVGNRCGPMDVDMMANDEGTNAWASRYRPPANSAFEGPLPNGQLWRPPRTN